MEMRPLIARLGRHRKREISMHKSFATFAAILITISASCAMAATPYVNLSSDDNQVAKTPMQPVPVTLSGGPATGFTVSGSKITFAEAGDYFVYVMNCHSH
jgi:hypothetical protein